MMTQELKGLSLRPVAVVNRLLGWGCQGKPLLVHQLDPLYVRFRMVQRYLKGSTTQMRRKT